MSAPLAAIELTRPRAAVNVLRSYGVLIDGRKVDSLEAGATRRYALPAGAHEIGVEMDFYKSLPLMLELRAGQTVRLECGERAPLLGQSGLSLRGLGAAFGSMLSPSDYFYLSVVGTEVAEAPAAGSATAAADRITPPPRLQASAEPMIFLSYRRDDTEHITGRIRDRLGMCFGEHAIFRDVDSIPAGMDFVRKVEETIRVAHAMVAIIGPQWAEATDRQGRRRLDQADDPVRFELETALGLALPLVPVLVKQARMPAREDLPASLAALPSINAVIIPPEPYFADGVKRLAAAIEALVAPAAPPTPARPQFCVACGHRIAPGQVFCTRCGQRV
ncbi:TIR domain-containing protein [Thauera sp. Sel9]|uniref:TIR domain-containing protein n=1 Tax=Thauera sp. Sel9 TaxID=2974299 RepID=UPI0021E1554B|nr:TIR domain-containing protein [Thauera sp. Sel9]MCV2217203.1 TIR domain-containing protein [Thauera sp. Sel9]